jgi:polyisoprenoid-binding protein YceI
MKNSILLLAFPLCTLIAAGDHAHDDYTLSGEYTVTINGTSNLRDWKENVGRVTGEMTAVLNPDSSIDLTSISIKMAVLSIKSDMGRVMDNKTYEALKATAYPEILFTLSTPLKLSQVSDGQQPVPVKGNLFLAGISRPVVMQVTTLAVDQGKWRLEGSEKIRMTDYGVKPPSALFGTMKAAPDITIYFKTNFIKPSLSTLLKNQG